MARFRHPRNVGQSEHAQFAVDVGGERLTLDADGCFEADPEDVQPIAAAFDTTTEALRVADESETCEVVKADGDVCGRELPCPYHSDE